jgi:hypothetical protein
VFAGSGVSRAAASIVGGMFVGLTGNRDTIHSILRFHAGRATLLISAWSDELQGMDHCISSSVRWYLAVAWFAIDCLATSQLTTLAVWNHRVIAVAILIWHHL